LKVSAEAKRILKDVRLTSTKLLESLAPAISAKAQALRLVAARARRSTYSKS